MDDSSVAGEQSSHPAPADTPRPSPRTLRGLDWVNFFLADVQTGVGPFLAIYLTTNKWNEERVGLALTVGGIAGIITQTPAGELVDRLRSKRALVAIGVVALAIGALLIALSAFILAGHGGAGAHWGNFKRFYSGALRHRPGNRRAKRL